MTKHFFSSLLLTVSMVTHSYGSEDPDSMQGRQRMKRLLPQEEKTQDPTPTKRPKYVESAACTEEQKLIDKTCNCQISAERLEQIEVIQASDSGMGNNALPFSGIIFIDNWKKNEKGIVSLKHSLSNKFSQSCDFDFLLKLLQDNRIPEDILMPLLSNLVEDRSLKFWNHIKSSSDPISQPVILKQLHTYWSMKEIKVDEILSAGFSIEEAFTGPFSRLKCDIDNVPQNLLENLATNTTLASLDFGGNSRGNLNGSWLKFLEKNTTLTSLYLPLLDRASFLCLGQALENNQALKLLDAPGLEGWPELAEMLSSNKTLTHMMYYSSPSFKTAATLLSNTTLRFIHLGGPYYVGQEDFNPDEANEFTQALRDNNTLETLKLTSFGIDSAGERSDEEKNFEKNFSDALGHNKTLKSLFIEELFMSDEGTTDLLEVIGKHSSLTSLSLNVDYPDTGLDVFLKGLETNTALTSLNFSAFSSNEMEQKFSKVLKRNKVLTSLSFS